MKYVNETVSKKQRPQKILQFGEGNFLRGFVDYMVDVANEKAVFDGSVTIVKPIEYGNLERFSEQDCVYTLILRGRQGGEKVVQKRIITCIDHAVDSYTEYESYAALASLDSLRFVVSNTTEAGIIYDDTDRLEQNPPKSFPGKLTKLLYERYMAFNGAADKGLIILPVELIEQNGTKLKECVLRLIKLWALEDGFTQWVEEHNIFCSTLVDRIITGYPAEEADALQEEMGYSDNLIVTGEPFGLWVIECDKPEIVQKEFPLDQAGMPVIFTSELRPYRERKVRLLNGAHTSTVLGAYLAGFDTVGQCMNDKTIRSFMEKTVYDEIAPTVNLPQEQVKEFADSVFERFDNPFIKHALLSIALNSVSKWKSRILPSLKDSLANTGVLPSHLAFSFAALMAFYSSDQREDGALLGKRGEETYKIMDDAGVLDFFAANSGKPTVEFVKSFAGCQSFWSEDLNDIPGFTDKVSEYLECIRKEGIAEAIRLL